MDILLDKLRDIELRYRELEGQLSDPQIVSKQGLYQKYAKEHADLEHHEDAPKSGPHGGRLFTEDGFGLELLLSEDGGEPTFRVWLFQQDKPLAPSAAKVSITLTRPGGEKQEILFALTCSSVSSIFPSCSSIREKKEKSN